MTENFLVSVIIPVYKVEKYLVCSIESIIHQTYSNWEMILIDDGSPDNCGEICDTYAKKDPRIKVFHQKNRGVSAARNFGINSSSGKYIAFCDSDDYCLPNWMETMVTEAERNSADLIVSSYLKVNEMGEQLELRKRYPGLWEFDSKEQRFDYIVRHVLDKRGEWNGWELWTSLFRRDIIIQNNVRICETSGNFAEDLGFVLEYLLFCNCVVCIDSPTYCYVQHENSMMAKSINDVKLNSLNEISSYYWKAFRTIFSEKRYSHYFSLIHFLLMNDQYEKIWYGEDAKRLQEETKKIKNRKWFLRQTRQLRWNKNRMISFFGIKRTKEYLLWNRYAQHGSWKVFRLDSAIVYKLLGWK